MSGVWGGHTVPLGRLSGAPGTGWCRPHRRRARPLTTAQANHTMMEAGMTHASGQGRSGMLNTVGSSYSRDFINGTSLSVTGAVPWIDTRNAGGQAGLELALPLMKGRGRSSD